jgi:hypothetical protein
MARARDSKFPVRRRQPVGFFAPVTEPAEVRRLGRLYFSARPSRRRWRPRLTIAEAARCEHRIPPPSSSDASRRTQRLSLYPLGHRTPPPSRARAAISPSTRSPSRRCGGWEARPSLPLPLSLMSTGPQPTCLGKTSSHDPPRFSETSSSSPLRRLPRPSCEALAEPREFRPFTSTPFRRAVSACAEWTPPRVTPSWLITRTEAVDHAPPSTCRGRRTKLISFTSEPAPTSFSPTD